MTIQRVDWALVIQKRETPETNNTFGSRIIEFRELRLSGRACYRFTGAVARICTGMAIWGAKHGVRIRIRLQFSTPASAFLSAKFMPLLNAFIASVFAPCATR
jgi:hypothetical protein